MCPTSIQTIATLISSDPTLLPSEHDMLAALISPQRREQASPNSETSLLLTQKEAARLLGIDRITVWRLKSMGILRPTEISPGTFRYQRAQMEALAQHGYRHLLGRRNAMAA